MTLINSVEAKLWMAIKTRLDQWTETQKYYPDDVFNPTANSAYLIIQDVSVEGDTRAVKVSCGEAIEGRLSVSVMAPLGWSWAQHKGLSGRVCDFLNASGDMVYLDASVRFNQRARSSGSPRLDQSWNRCEVIVPYRTWG